MVSLFRGYIVHLDLEREVLPSSSRKCFMFKYSSLQKLAFLHQCLSLFPCSPHCGPFYSLCQFKFFKDWHPHLWDLEQFGVYLMFVFSITKYFLIHYYRANTWKTWFAIFFSPPMILLCPPYVLFLRMNWVLKIHIGWRFCQNTYWMSDPACLRPKLCGGPEINPFEMNEPICLEPNFI